MDKIVLRVRILMVLILFLIVMNCFIGWKLFHIESILDSAEKVRGGGNGCFFRINGRH